LQKLPRHCQNPAPTTVELHSPKKVEEVKFNTFAHSDKIFVFPFVKSMGKEHGISNEELKKIKRTGLGGRITKEDVLRYLKQCSSQPSSKKKQLLKTRNHFFHIDLIR